MGESTLIRILKSKKEEDSFDFKQKLKLYQADGKVSEYQRDELIKDILGLANGNGQIVRQTKYLIIGADDKQFDEQGMRVLYNVDYPVPPQSDVIKWVNSACSPAIVGVQCGTQIINGASLFVIAIPPTFDIHETTRELNASGHFNKYTVFMRQDEHTVPASVRDGVAIEKLKHMYRHEVANPSAVWLGAIIGAIISLVFWTAGYNSKDVDSDLLNIIGRIVIITVGAFGGAEMGWISQLWRTTRYDWRYMTSRQKIGFVAFVIVLVLLVYCIRIWWGRQ